MFHWCEPVTWAHLPASGAGKCPCLGSYFLRPTLHTLWRGKRDLLVNWKPTPSHLLLSFTTPPTPNPFQSPYPSYLSLNTPGTLLSHALPWNYLPWGVYLLFSCPSCWNGCPRMPLIKSILCPRYFKFLFSLIFKIMNLQSNLVQGNSDYAHTREVNWCASAHTASKSRSKDLNNECKEEHPALFFFSDSQRSNHSAKHISYWEGDHFTVEYSGPLSSYISQGKLIQLGFCL